MNITRHIFAIGLVWLLTLTAAFAQDDDKGFLTRKIQDALSGAGRTVSIDGFSGVLSSQASFDRMTIADKDGIWLTLTDVVLDWNRSALLRGRLDVNSLTAKSLDIPRLPVSDAPPLPDAEATPFALPELPVAINVADFAVDSITLGSPILGQPVQMSVKASALLDDDAANIDFLSRRTDGKRGEFAIKADFQRGDSLLDLLVKLSEEQDGIAAKLLNLPDRPAVDMTIAGKGPLDDLVTDVTIATDGKDRLAGQITLGAQSGGSDTPDRRIKADIGGDITALLAPQYRDFFGTDVSLTVDALVRGDGGIDVDTFALDAEAAKLAGKVILNQDKWPSFIGITGTIVNRDGSAVLLPVAGAGTKVSSLDLRVDYNADKGEVFAAAFDLADLETGGIEIARTTLKLDGTLQGNLGSVGQFLGDMTFAANGLVLSNAASAEAVGQQITGRANINYIEGQPIRISDLDLSGADYGLTGKAVINGLEQGFLTRLDMALKAQDISRFSALAGREIDGATALALKGTVTPLGGMFDLTASGTTQDLKLGIEQADAVLAGRTDLNMQASRDETGTFLRDLVLQNAALNLNGMAELRTGDSKVSARFKLNDVGLVLPQYNGPITVTADAVQDTRGWSVDAVTDGPYGAALTANGLATGPNAELIFTADIPDISDFAPDVTGAVKARGVLRQTPDGWSIDTNASGPYSLRASVQGLVAPVIDIRFDASLPDVNPLVPQVKGPLQASGTLRQTDKGFIVDTVANGPYGARAFVQGLATGPDMSLSFDLSLPNVNPLVPQLNGPLKATGTVNQTEDGIFVDTNASGPYGARALVKGLATGPDMALTFDVSVPNVQPLLPGASGPLAAKGSLRQTPDGFAINTDASGPYNSRASVQGVVTGPNAAVQFDLSLPNVGVFVEQLSGPLAVKGSASKQGGGWRIDTDATGPAGTQSTIAGVVNENGTLDLRAQGTAPLGLAKPFIAPRDLQGMVRFDLSVNGPPRLSSLGGTLQIDGATLSAPNLRVALEGINADVRLGNNRASVDATAQVIGGGRIRVGGNVTLTPSLSADLQLALQDVVLIDPKLYRTSLGGNLRLAGPLAGGALLSGQIDVGETNISVPSTGLTSIGDIPPITHINARDGVIATRARAGLNGNGAGDDPAVAATGPGIALDIRINAPNRVFVRGRGLDAELGGTLGITGTTRQIISAGRIELIRGRLDILGKRFELVEGAIQFEGDLIPYLKFVSVTKTRTGEVRVILSGPANEPEVTFQSSPDAPQDEVLAQLLFGRNIADITAFQALQLANAVATLAGRGGTGIISNLREGFGLDDFDVTTTDDGATAVRAGKYLAENVYTDVQAASDGSAEVSLNLDITTNFKAKATLGSDGDSSLGLFYEKDY